MLRNDMKESILFKIRLQIYMLKIYISSLFDHNKVLFRIRAYYYKWLLNYYNIYPIGYTIYFFEHTFIFDNEDEIDEDLYTHILNKYVDGWWLYTINGWYDAMVNSDEWDVDRIKKTLDTTIWFNRKSNSLRKIYERIQVQNDERRTY